MIQKMGNSVNPFKQERSSFAYQPLTMPLLSSVEAQNEDPRVFSFKELKKATNKFRQERVVECEDDSIRTFYKGYIDETTFAPSRTGNGIEISVMKCDRSRTLQDWMAVVKSLGHISHPNLVNFLGYCCEDNKPLFLVFEYSHKGSLDRHLFGKEEEALPWETRVKIAIGTARGIAYIHSIKNSPIHRELRMYNIMLDEQYNAKLFYLESRKPYLEDEAEIFRNYEHISPEFAASGYFDMGADVYVFGRILLELLTGTNARRILRKHQTSVLHDTYIIKEVIDPRLGNDYPANAATKMGTLIKQCSEEAVKKRPLIQSVLNVLDDIAETKD